MAGQPPYFTVLVLVAGVCGGLILVMAVIFFCKYCIHTTKPLKRQAAIVNRATSSDRSIRHGKVGKECESLVSTSELQPSGTTQIKESTEEVTITNSGLAEDEEHDIDEVFAQYKQSLKVNIENEEDPVRTRNALVHEEERTTTSSPSPILDGSISGENVFDTPPLTPAIPESLTQKVSVGQRLSSGHQLVHSKSVGYTSNRYVEGDYHHLKKAKIDRSPAVAEFVKQHSVGGVSLDSGRERLEEIPLSLRLDPLDKSKRTTSGGGLVKPMFRDHGRSASSQSMQIYKDTYHLDPRVPRGSSVHRLQKALSEDRSQSFPESLAKSVEPKSKILEEEVYRDNQEYRDHNYRRDRRGSVDGRGSREKLTRMMTRDERMKAYAHDRTKSMYDTRVRAFLDSKTRSASTIKVLSDEQISSHELTHSYSATRLRRPSIGEVRAISPNLTRRIGDRPVSPYLKKQRSMSEDLPVSPLVYKQQSVSKDSLPAMALRSGSLHQVAVEVHHEPNIDMKRVKSPTRGSKFIPPSTSSSRLTVKKEAVMSRSFELTSPSHRERYPQRRVKSYEDGVDPEQYMNHDRLEITQFLRGAFYNADFDVMSEECVPGELKSKVRYNDIGSLEEINEDRPIDEIVTETLTVDDSETETSSTINGNNPKYKDLWNLRTTLEEEEDFSDTIRMEDMTSPDDQSAEEKEKSPGTSYTTSFESNTEPVIDHDHGDESYIRVASSNLLTPHQNRRQTYRTILDKRVRQPHTSAQTSLDSMETMETDGEVSDTSRHEVTTTSFESTTGSNTDSTGDGSNSHKLQQMRGDSGYKSLETQQSQGQNESHVLRTGSKKQIHFVLDGKESIHNLSPSPTGENTLSPPTAASVITAGPSTSHAQTKNSKQSGFDRRNGKTASRKRRDFRSDRKAIQVYDSIQEPESDQPSGDSFEEPTQRRFSIFSKIIKSKSERRPTLSRDYSVDSKTDALFNEFMRHDPTLGSGSRRQSKLSINKDMLQAASVPASFDMSGNGRREKLSPAIRSVSLGSDSSAASSLLPVSPHASIEEEDLDSERKTLLPPSRPLPHGSPSPTRPPAVSIKDTLTPVEGTRRNRSPRRSFSECGPSIPNIVIKHPTEDEE